MKIERINSFKRIAAPKTQAIFGVQMNKSTRSFVFLSGFLFRARGRVRVRDGVGDRVSVRTS